MNKECNIVKDLLPLYIEGMVSDDSALFIEEHIKNCSECKELFNSMKGNDESVAIEENLMTDNGLVIKNVKKKLKKKKILTILLSVVLTFSGIFAYFLLEPSFVVATVDYGNSNLYSKEDINEAVKVVKDKFNTFEGCTMYKLSYTSDKISEKELKYANAHAPEGVVYTDCIVFESEFRSPIFGGGAWNANTIYNWSWTLVRINDGPWELINWGFA